MPTIRETSREHTSATGALASSSTAMVQKAVGDVLPQVTVLPVKPLLITSVAHPALGLAQPLAEQLRES